MNALALLVTIASMMTGNTCAAIDNTANEQAWASPGSTASCN